MPVLNPVLPSSPSWLPLPDGRAVVSGLNEIDAALAAAHQKSAERIVALVFWLKALVTSTAMRAWQPIASWLDPRTDWQYDQYLQGSVDCADLERRIRNWERRPLGWH